MKPETFSLSKVKHFWQACFPGFYAALQHRRWTHNLHQMIRAIVAKHGATVQSGPFEGMRYVPEMLGPEKVFQHAVLPKILGCYETELHAILMRELRRSNYRQLVNIGCSEGYYAVGLALRLPGAHIFAFDVDPDARQLCERMALLNGVADRVTIDGECTTERLESLATGGTLVICDCEGCEAGLLRPDLVPGLTHCDLIVELHDCVDPTISRVVPARFAPTHEITLLSEVARDPSAYPVLQQFNPYQRRLAVGEFRWGAPPVWALISSRHEAPASPS